MKLPPPVAVTLQADSTDASYGPGTAVTSLADGRVRVSYLATFHRWDGAWRPHSVLDRSAGEWPYLAEESASEIRVTRLGQTFVQGKSSSAIYEFLPQGVKETLVLRSRPSIPTLSIPFSTTYTVVAGEDYVLLRDPSGAPGWITMPFHAWDSSASPRTWARPVVLTSYSGGRLWLSLDSDMISTATYPLYIDPTWITNAGMGWPGIESYDNAFPDFGDGAYRIGWISDNFDDNMKDFIWTTDAGSWTISGGAAQLDVLTRIRTLSAGRWNESFQANVKFTVAGAAKMLFRWIDASNHYYLDISDAANTVALKKVASGATSTLASAPTTISTGQFYRVKVVQEGASFTVVWGGSTLLTATDSSPSTAPPDYQSVGFETYGRKTKLTLDDVRRWTGQIGVLTSSTRNAVPEALRTVHAGSTYNWVDLRIHSSPDNETWPEWPWATYVKAGAETRTSDADAYFVPDSARRPYYRVQIDLRSTDDFSPALSEIAVIEGSVSGPSENSQVLGFAPWQYYVGGMVNIVNGNLFLRSMDLSLPGKGWTLDFTRAYNSRDSVVGPLGPGWTHAYGVSLTSVAGAVQYRDGDGSIHVFEALGGGAYASPPGLSDTKLVGNGDGTYTMFWKDGSRWSFSSLGKLADMRDRNGNKVTMTYDASGRLLKVADDSGVFLVLAYDGSGRLVRVGDHNLTVTQRNATTHIGSWSNGQNGFTSNNAYASTKTASATHRYAGYGFTGPSDAWITKVEACVEAYTAGDDDLGLKVSVNSGSTWSVEQVLNLPSGDPNDLTCVDFTSHKASWSWADLSDSNFRVEVRYVKVGNQASFDYLDWIPVRVTAASRFVSYSYDGSGNLAAVKDSMGNDTLYTYSAVLERYVDRADKVVRFVTDGSSRVTEVWTGRYDRVSGTIPWEFRMYGITFGDWTTRTATVSDASGNVTAIQYDALGGRPTVIDGPLASSGGGCSCCGSSGSEKWAIEWDGEHNWLSRTDALNQTARVAYDWRGNILESDEGSTPGGYTGQRNVVNTWQNRDNGTVFDVSLVEQQRFRSGLGWLATTFEYDWKGNLVKKIDPLGNFTQNLYNSDGLVTKLRDKRGFNTTFAYDAHGWRLTMTDPLGHETRFDYDAVGRGTSVTTPLGFSTRFAYDPNGRPVSTTNPLGFSTRYAYNARGELVSTTDANGNLMQYVVNLTWGRVERTIEATGDVTEHTFDVLGRLVQVKDPAGRIWAHEYDRFGRRVRETDPLGNVIQFVHDAAGNVATRIDGRGRSSHYYYDSLNRVLDVYYPSEYSGGPSFRYDEDGNVVLEEYWASRLGGLPPMFRKEAEYDALSRPVRVTSWYDYGAFSATIEYTYDENGNRKTMAYPDSYSVAYGWDEDNRLVSESFSGQTWTFAYDADNRRISLRNPNGIQTNYTYNAADWLLSVQTLDTADWSAIDGYSYTYDNVGNQMTQAQLNGTSLSYAYEEDYSLNATTYEQGETSYYVYDGNGNRLYKNETTGLRTSYQYENDSSLRKQVVRSDAGALLLDVTYSYDGNGNLVSKVEQAPGRAPIQYGYDYDDENRLVRVSVGGSEQASYAYGPDGSRIRRTEAGTPTFFLYDFQDFNGFNDILGELNATGAARARYVHGPGIDEPLAKFDKTEDPQGAWYYYHTDGRGSVTMLTRADKSVANRYVYDDFGRIRHAAEAVPNAYGFTSRERDAVGLMYYRARYHDAEAGRFIQRDPGGMRDGPNRYNYATNNPVSRVDPGGRAVWMLPDYYPSPSVFKTQFAFLIGVSLGQMLDTGCEYVCDVTLQTALKYGFCHAWVGSACLLATSTIDLSPQGALAAGFACLAMTVVVCLALDFGLVEPGTFCTALCQELHYTWLYLPLGSRTAKALPYGIP